METNNKPKGINIPETVTNPEEREYFELIEKAFNIARKNQMPIMCLAAYDDISKAFVGTLGCPKCLANLIVCLLKKDPQMEGILMSAIVSNTVKGMKDKQISDYAKKNSPAGN